MDVLFGRYRRQVLALVLLRPEETFHVREISRLTGLPVGSLHRELKLLTEAGLLVRSEVGNQVRYQANRMSPVFEELAAIFRKTLGLADILRDALKPLRRDVRLALIFGSVAQGKERATSDVDVLVLGSVPFEKVLMALARTQERLGREVNPVVMTVAVFQAKRETRDRFVTRVLREPKIFLIGDVNDLGELIADRSPEDARA